jgi:outer membrane immunogenic protein
MRHIKLGLLAGAALSIGLVQADAANWTGFYIGGNAGYSWGSARTDVRISPQDDIGGSSQNDFPGDFVSESLKPRGVVGGIQAGFNAQTGNWVYGFETDFQGSAQKDSSRTAHVVIGPCTTGPTCSYFSTTDLTAKLSWFGTVRGRIGQDLNGLLVYATGGLAYGGVKLSGVNTVAADLGLGVELLTTSVFDMSSTKVGYTVGAGLEGAFPANNKLSWRAEYLYIDLGSVTATTVAFSSITTKVTDNIFRFGLNFRP